MQPHPEHPPRGLPTLAVQGEIASGENDGCVASHPSVSLDPSESQFRDLANAMPHMVWMSDAHGQGSFANQKLLEVLGNESLAQWENTIHPEDRPESLRRYVHAMSSGETYRVEHRLFDQRSGQYVWYLAQATPARNARGEIVSWYGTATEINDLKKVENDLRHERDRFSAIAAASPGVIFTFREAEGHHSLVYAAPTFERLFGIEPEKLLHQGEQVVQYIHEEDLPRVYLKSRQMLESGQESVIQFRVRHPRSGIVWIECHAAPRRCDDGSVLWHGVFTDITQRKRLETQVMQATKLEAIGRLAGGIAHDFNNLLTAIISACDLATMPAQTADTLATSIATIRTASQRAAGLTKQLLAFSRQQEITLQELDLNQVIQESETILRRLSGPGVQIKLSLDPNIPSIMADATQLVQILINLVLNARDALPQGGLIEIATSIHAIEPALPLDSSAQRSSTHSAPSEPAAVSLKIIDNGLGIPEAIQPRVFDPFFTTKPTGKGTGLGLAVVHGIVTQCRAKIALNSSPGQGTQIEIVFPQNQRSIDGCASDVKAANPSTTTWFQPRRPYFLATSATTRPRILIVDDELDVAEITAKILEPHGYDVIIAQSPHRALEYLALPEVSPIDLLITDLMMPDGRGDQFALRVREIRRDLPIMIWSGHPEDRCELDEQLRDVVYLAKPYAQEDLLARIQSLLLRRTEPIETAPESSPHSSQSMGCDG